MIITVDKEILREEMRNWVIAGNGIELVEVIADIVHAYDLPFPYTPLPDDLVGGASDTQSGACPNCGFADVKCAECGTDRRAEIAP